MSATRRIGVKWIVLPLFASLALIGACQPKQVSETTTTTGTPPTTVVLASDDIVNTPAGPAYRGNVNQQGVKNPFLPVQTTVVPFPGPEDLPSGFEALPVQTAVSPMTKAVMEIHISSAIQPGKYSFQIRTKIDGQDYGDVLCTVDVTSQ